MTPQPRSSVACGLLHLRSRILSDTGILLLIGVVNRGRSRVAVRSRQISEVELDNGFEHLGDRAAMQTIGQSREPIAISCLHRQQFVDGVAPSLGAAASVGGAAWVGSDRRWLRQVACSIPRLALGRRNGTANLFVFLDAHRPWRHVKVTDQPGRHPTTGNRMLPISRAAALILVRMSGSVAAEGSEKGSVASLELPDRSGTSAGMRRRRHAAQVRSRPAFQRPPVHRRGDSVGGPMVFDVSHQLPRSCADAAGSRRVGRAQRIRLPSNAMLPIPRGRRHPRCVRSCSVVLIHSKL